MSRLVRIVAPAGQRPHMHEGMVVCRDHLQQIGLAASPPLEEIPAAQVSFWGYRCLMCGVEPVPDRLCVNEDCGRPLHERWPAVYCCNDCALEDV